MMPDEMLMQVVVRSDDWREAVEVLQAERTNPDFRDGFRTVIGLLGMLIEAVPTLQPSDLVGMLAAIDARYLDPARASGPPKS